MIEVVRGFLYPKYIVRTSSCYTRIGTFSFMLWCDERKNNKKLKVRNMTLECQSIFSKGRQKDEQMWGLLNRKDRRCILYQVCRYFINGKRNYILLKCSVIVGGGSQFLHPKEAAKALASRKDTAGVTRANFILSVVFYAGNTVIK